MSELTPLEQEVKHLDGQIKTLLAELAEAQAEIERLRAEMHTFYNRGFNEGVAFRDQQDGVGGYRRGHLQQTK